MKARRTKRSEVGLHLSDQAAYGTALLAAGLIDKSLMHETAGKAVSVS